MNSRDAMNARDRVSIGALLNIGEKAAVQVAMTKRLLVEIVDPNPVDIGYDGATYHRMRASEYVDIVA
ncbi:MAG: hypothetical protein AAFN07_09630 [Pseudomonadota bacterium]